MGNARTSNKDILSAIEGQTAAIAALVQALTPNQPQVITPAVKAEPVAPESTSIDIPKGYMTHMEQKVSKLTASDGQARVLYARRNLNHEVKLAYALKSRYDTGLKDHGFIGVVKVYK